MNGSEPKGSEPKGSYALTYPNYERIRTERIRAERILCLNISYLIKYPIVQRILCTVCNPPACYIKELYDDLFYIFTILSLGKKLRHRSRKLRLENSENQTRQQRVVGLKVLSLINKFSNL